MFDKTTLDTWLNLDKSQLLDENGGRFVQYSTFKLLSIALLTSWKLLETFKAGGGVRFEYFSCALAGAGSRSLRAL